MKNILVTQRIFKDKHGHFSDRLENNYINFLSRFDINPILLPNSGVNTISYLSANKCKGIILTGGEDINPSLYSKNKSLLDPYFDIRDDNEIELLKYSVEKKVPLLGICRGSQLTNVYFKGGLTSNLFKINSNFKNKKHKVSLFNKPFGFQDKSIEVNSFHNQGILDYQLSSELIVLAKTDVLNNIELFKHKVLPIIGMQWHPERTNDSEVLDILILKTFINFIQ